MVPVRQGLYDPRNEHHACGVGFIVDVKGRKSNDIVRQGLQILVNLDHRGAVGADPLVGDGSGCLIQIPDKLLRAWADGAGITLPQPGDYAVAMCFLPQNAEARDAAIAQRERFVTAEGQHMLGWRDLPTDTNGLGQTRSREDAGIRQAVIASGANVKYQDAFERKLLAARKQIQIPL